MNENKPRLLVVDDEEEIREFAGSYFKRRGYIVLVADSGEEALAIIREQSPDIMLLDMNLPKMSGIELLKLVRQFNNIVKVIMVSGYELNSNDPQFQELDIFGFMRKPIGFIELESAIKKAIA